MRTYLLPEQGTFYKANLHCHTTFSDGSLTPSEVRELYRKNGYSVVAFTDHEVLVPHPELRTPDFLPLNGVEVSIIEKDRRDKSGKKFHFCCIALEESNVLTPCFHPDNLHHNAAELRTLVRPEPKSFGLPHDYTPEQINRLMGLAKEAGFFLTYNHPDWSLEDFDTYSQYVGMDALEVYNNCCNCIGYEAYVPNAYEALLRHGRKLFCVYADDNHNDRDDACGGWVMIKADALEYRTVTKALQEGSFYASQGPEIHALYIEDGKLRVECSAASRIRFITGIRRRGIFTGEGLTEASFPLTPADGYVRVQITDAQGRHADSNAYPVPGV